MGGVRTGSRWRAARAQVFREEKFCHFCGDEVDQSLPYKDPITQGVNTWSKSVHHLDPHPTRETVARRGRLRLAHVGCNSSFGDGSRVKARTSRRW